MEKRGKGRPRKFQNEVVLTLRLDQELVEAFDNLAAKIRQKDGIQMSRVDLIRKAMKHFIDRESE